MNERDESAELDRDVDEGEGRVLSVHFGRAASCSSVGSVIDVLFLSTVAGAAVISALGVWLAREANEAESGTKVEAEAETRSENPTETKSENVAETKSEAPADSAEPTRQESSGD